MEAMATQMRVSRVEAGSSRKLTAEGSACRALLESECSDRGIRVAGLTSSAKLHVRTPGGCVWMAIAMVEAVRTVNRPECGAPYICC